MSNNDINYYKKYLKYKSKYLKLRDEIKNLNKLSFELIDHSIIENVEINNIISDNSIKHEPEYYIKKKYLRGSFTDNKYRKFFTISNNEMFISDNEIYN